MDLNGDGEVNLKDALWGASAIGVSAGAAAATGYLSGAALVSATSSARATLVAGKFNRWSFGGDFIRHNDCRRIICG